MAERKRPRLGKQGKATTTATGTGTAGTAKGKGKAKRKRRLSDEGWVPPDDAGGSSSSSDGSSGETEEESSDDNESMDSNRPPTPTPTPKPTTARAKAGKQQKKRKKTKTEATKKAAVGRAGSGAAAAAGDAPGALVYSKKRVRKDKSGLPILTVSLTGARAGDVLTGAPDCDDTANVCLKVVTGVVRAPVKLMKVVPREEVVRAIAKKQAIALERAEMAYNDIPRDAGSFPNHQPIGKTCNCGAISAQQHGCTCPVDATFVILQQGVWQGFAEDSGQGATLEQYVRDQAEVTWRDILNLMGRKTLVLRPKLFQVDASPVALSKHFNTADKLVVDCTRLPHPTTGGPLQGGAEEDPTSELYEVAPGHYARIPKPAERRLGKDEVVDAVLRACPRAERRDAELSVAALRPLTEGALKSALQKAIRFGAKRTLLPACQEGDGEQDVGGAHLAAAAVPSPVFAAAACGLLFADAGMFSPELQLFTRGCTAALKRTAVILVEDAWIAKKTVHTPGVVTALLALARATQVMGKYEPPPRVVEATMYVCYLAAKSGTAINYRGQNPDKATPASLAATDADTGLLAEAAALLGVVRSFRSDVEMFETVAAMARRGGKLRVLRGGTWGQPEACPMHHLVDQHVYRGVGHLAGPALGLSFKTRFERTFAMVTGRNYRCHNVGGFEAGKVVAATRFAQAQILRLAYPVAQQSRAALPAAADGSHMTVSIPLDPGVLASAIGPVSVKHRRKEYIVTLGTIDVDSEMVMVRASRNAKNLYEGISPEDRAAIILELRGRTLPIRRSPLVTGQAQFLASPEHPKGTWCLNGSPWPDVVERGLSAEVPLHPAPAWAANPPVALTDDAALAEALFAVGDGCCEGAQEAVRALVRSAGRETLLRAQSLLRQQYELVAMPTPGIRGGRGSDQMMAYTGDWGVYRLLALLARLVPGALRAQQVPRFAIPNPSLLRILERWISDAATSSAAADAAPNPWPGHKSWTRLVDCDAQMRDHQLSAVNDMIQRDGRGVPGHFLVMDVGFGKTLTTLSYLWRWLCRSAAASSVSYFIWTTPTSIVKDTGDQIRDKWRAPTHTVKRPRPKEHVCLRKFHVNVMSMDLARDVLERGLADIAPEAVFVFDEVDKVYGNSLRTSAAQRLAMTCAKFVCQTATPMTSTKDERLAWWLASTELYPVNKRNYLVAANGMVSKQIELGIETEEVLTKVPMHPAVREAYKASGGDWMRMAKATQDHTDAAMVERAVAHAGGDAGGVLLVGNDRQHVERLVALVSAQGVRAGSLDVVDDARYPCVVVTKRESRGYNGAIRLGAMVTGTYGSNGADRYQLRGRLKRIGQVRPKVVYETVIMENSLLDLLHVRQQRVDTMNISIKDLGERFGREVLEGMGP